MSPNRLSIFDIATMYEGRQDSATAVPEAHIKISTSRRYYGNKSTLSEFIATAYDKNGKSIKSINGYFLEPKVDYDSATIEGSKKAILGGKYQIVPKQYESQRYQWYLKGVDGRTGIAIHKGNNGTDSKGCLIPGTSYSYDSDNNEYKVWESGAKLEELTNFFKKYGNSGIEINITPL